MTFLRVNGLATLAFLVLVPLAMGAIPLLFSDADQVAEYHITIFVPWGIILVYFGLCFVFLKEGGACLAVIAAPFAALGMIGLLIAWIVRALRIRRSKRRAMGVTLMLLPFLVVGLEQRYLVREETVTVTSRTIVDVPAADLFDQLAEFETIREEEYRPGFFHRLGVPRPIRATTDKRGLGGHRVGVFEHGLRFQELITAYDPPSRMAFDIAVDASTLRPGSMERHAFETGYFRFVDATYVLTPLEGDRVEIQLSSRYVARSSVNAYGKLWANAIVGDFQERVLELLRRRCGVRPAAPPAELAAARHPQ